MQEISATKSNLRKFKTTTGQVWKQDVRWKLYQEVQYKHNVLFWNNIKESNRKKYSKKETYWTSKDFKLKI